MKNKVTLSSSRGTIKSVSVLVLPAGTIFKYNLDGDWFIRLSSGAANLSLGLVFDEDDILLDRYPTRILQVGEVLTLEPVEL